MAEAKTTTDHDEIRRWVEERGAVPARVEGTNILRINFVDEPGGDDDARLEEVGWDDWFRIFDENDLAFLSQDEPDSRFNKLVSRENAG